MASAAKEVAYICEFSPGTLSQYSDDSFFEIGAPPMKGFLNRKTIGVDEEEIKFGDFPDYGETTLATVIDEDPGACFRLLLIG